VAAWVLAAALGVVVLGRARVHPAPPVSATAASDPVLADFYRARGGRPLWFQGAALRPEAARFVGLLREAGADDLIPQAYHPDQLAAELSAAQHGGPADRARAERDLSRTLAAYVADLRRPLPGAGMLYPDEALRPPATGERQILDEAAAAPSLGAFLDAAHQVNPLYARLRAALAAQRAHPATTDAPPRLEALIRANMERARALPADLGARYVLVNAPAARVWVYSGGQPIGTMRVVVGKPTDQTPQMAALIRYAVRNPYWNLPPDLVRVRLAPKAIASGGANLLAQHMQVLSDWSADAVVVDPATVDWASVASGAQILRVRQLPGPGNMMGAVKFMFPNALGVYLHDTPNHAAFGADQRLLSAGCVRLENAGLMGQWLFGHPLARGATQPEQRVELTPPTPVYLTYFTVAADGPDGAVSVLPDIYGRDAPLLAQMQRAGRLR
jgi:murein L,D-transpeptidase YcbB/YkuD